MVLVMYLLKQENLEFTTVNGKLTVWFPKSLLLSWKLFLFGSCFLFFQLSFSFLTGHRRHLVCHLMFQDWMGPIHKWKWKGCDFSSWKHIHFILSKKHCLHKNKRNYTITVFLVLYFDLKLDSFNPSLKLKMMP